MAQAETRGAEEKKQSTKAWVDRVLGWVLVALMAVSVVNVLWQVFTRFVLGTPSAFTEELARYLLIWIGVLGAGYAAGQKAHLALELLPERLEGRREAMLEMFIQACVALFALAVMVAGGARLVYVQLALGQTSPAMNVPLGLVYTVVPISGMLMLFYAALNIAAARRRLKRGDASTAETSGEPEHRRAAGMSETEAMGDADSDAPPSDDTDGRKALPVD